MKLPTLGFVTLGCVGLLVEAGVVHFEYETPGFNGNILTQDFLPNSELTLLIAVSPVTAM
jgi:hypothetical protein